MATHPSLYALTCKVYNKAWIPRHPTKFEKVMTNGKKPCLTLMHISNNIYEFPYDKTP